MHTSSAYVQAAFDREGTGYLVKSSAREEILAAVVKDIHNTEPPFSGFALAGFVVQFALVRNWTEEWEWPAQTFSSVRVCR